MLGVIVCLLAWSSETWSNEQIIDTHWQSLFVTENEYHEVRENIEIAITGRGMVINNIAHIGKMLDRTGADLGYTEQIYRQAEVFEFCSAKFSRDMMAANPYNIVFCPFTMHVFELSGHPGLIHVGYRRPSIVGDSDSRQALERIDSLLRSIVDEALSF